MSRFEPLTPDRLAARLGDAIARLPNDIVRVAVDAPRCAHPLELAQLLRQRLLDLGRQSLVIGAESFYRDASLRLEYGKTDLESFYSGWLDHTALQREVLSPAAASVPASVLPSLRDPVTNRSTRAQRVELDAGSVVLVAGELLLGTGLEFDVTVHASVSRAARRRNTEPDWQWTLPAFDRYDVDVDPSALADYVVRYDDPAHPALRSPTEQ